MHRLPTGSTNDIAKAQDPDRHAGKYNRLRAIVLSRDPNVMTRLSSWWLR
jgi:hypothetical protein